jgi:transcriptional regulator with XRE-family HTH domain
MPDINGEILRAWRRSHGWDVPEMARQLRRIARGQIADHDGLVRMIRDWERGRHKLTERYELLYAAAFRVNPDLLGGGPAPTLASPDLAQPPALSFTLGMTGVTLSDAIGGTEETDVDRRAFNIAALGLLAGTLAPSGPAPATVTASDTRRLREIADGMWAKDWTVGGNALLRDAIKQYTNARGMLDHSSYTASVGLELQALAAELAACAGFTAFDAGVPALARGLLSESSLLAGSTGDPVPTAHAYALLALQSTSLASSTGRTGPAREALRFLDQAADAARHEPSPRLHATICMRRATASALLGDAIEARKNITGARRELDRGDHPADPDWAGFVTPSEITAHEAMAAFSQGQPTTAANLFRDVLADDALPSRNRALYRARLAMSLHAAGDRAEAVSEGLRVLPLLEGPVRSARTLHQLRPVRQGAAPDSEFAARFDAAARSATYAAAS